jgi:hypothetical protein
MAYRSCVVWAPLKLIFMLLEKRNRGYDKLAAKLTAFVDALPRYNLYCDHFRDSRILQNALGMLYVAYIEFCLRAVQYFESDGLSMMTIILVFEPRWKF